ncbi:hypothetical protein CSOJ01_10615 [Colletotrichum sojae]|uniref:Uncharacterized protein n=1 Tax=Colletotrichum sojae TaxID=2175907 RepID=A0A8H6J0E8_9PEZI|nr:hypothetical protein CSOJ01_10615 [Colletotrichum sojae]
MGIGLEPSDASSVMGLVRQQIREDHRRSHWQAIWTWLRSWVMVEFCGMCHQWRRELAHASSPTAVGQFTPDDAPRWCCLGYAWPGRAAKSAPKKSVSAGGQSRDWG